MEISRYIPLLIGEKPAVPNQKPEIPLRNCPPIIPAVQSEAKDPKIEATPRPYLVAN
jgi:hypothetical protein